MKYDGNKTIKKENWTQEDSNGIIAGYMYRPIQEAACPAVILSHGYNGSGHDFERECMFFAEHGFAAFAFDFCGGSVTSKSSGKTTDMTVFTEKADLTAVLAHVLQEKFVDKAAVFLFGGSQGGLVSSLVAAEHVNEVRGMILYYPAFCIPEDWNRKYPDEAEIPETFDFWNMVLGNAYVSSIRGFDPYQQIGKFKKEVLIIHGDQDDIVRPEYSERARDQYSNAELVILPGEGHGYSEAGGMEAQELSLKFMKEVLK